MDDGDVNQLLDEEWLTVKAVARRLNLSTRMVYKLVQAGALKGVRVGRAIRIPKRFLCDYVRGFVGDRQ